MDATQRFSEISKRYAAAAFELAKEASKQDSFFNELEQLTAELQKNKDLVAFIKSPLVSAAEKEKVFSAGIKNAGLSIEAESLILLLAQKERLVLLPEIVAAYKQRLDLSSGVSRGQVRSAAELSATEKQELAGAISQITNKKVELDYVVDKSLLGGAAAQIGSFSFDDSTAAHLRRLQENLNRSVN